MAVVAVLGAVFVPRLALPPDSVVFQPAPTPTAGAVAGEPEDLLDRTYVSTQLQRREGPLLPGTSITLSLWREGKEGAGWESGCNGSTGSLNVDEQTLSIRQTSTTLMGCGEGNEQDDWVVGFLESGPRWELVGETLVLTSGDSRIVFTDADHTAVDATPTEKGTAGAPVPADERIGPRLSIRDLPSLPSEGAAVTVDGSVVLIGVDGTVHGHIPGRLANGPFYGFAPKRQGLTHLLRVEPDGGPVTWVDPPSGRYLEGYEQAAPLRASSAVVYDAHSGPSDEMQLERGPQREPIGWPATSQWFVSADHRLVTWLPCDDGRCAPKVYDSDNGGVGALEEGCRAAHAFADFAVTLICDDGRSLALPQRGAGVSGRVPVPPAEDGEDRRFVAVYDNGIVRVDTPGCRASRALRIRYVTLLPVEPDGDLRGASMVPLGVLDDGRVVVHANADAQCGMAAAEPGVYVLDPDTGDTTQVWSGAASVNEIQMWAPTYAL